MELSEETGNSQTARIDPALTGLAQDAERSAAQLATFDPSEPNIIIAPAVGRRLYFRPHPEDHSLTNLDAHKPLEEQQPMDCGVLYVHSASVVNLLVTDHTGKTRAMSHVPLRQPHDAKPTYGGYCEWMPWQVQQELKARAAASIPGTYNPGPSTAMEVKS